MTTLHWILVGAGAWFVLSILTALMLGAMFSANGDDFWDEGDEF